MKTGFNVPTINDVREVEYYPCYSMPRLDDYSDAYYETKRAKINLATLINFREASMRINKPENVDEYNQWIESERDLFLRPTIDPERGYESSNRPPMRQIEITGTIILLFPGTELFLSTAFEDFDEEYTNYLAGEL